MVVGVLLHVGVVTVSPLLHVVASFSPVVKFISPIFNFLQQGATDSVPIKETKSKHIRKHGLQYSDIHDIKACYVHGLEIYNIHLLDECLSLRFILSIFP